MRTRLTNCEVMDPSKGERFWGYVEWEDGVIKDVGHAGPGLDDAGSGDSSRIVDGRGHLLAPSFVDLFADFCEPGFEYREDVASGSAAAASGGYTFVCLDPETDPVCDGADTARFILDRGADAGLVDLSPCGAISKGMKGGSIANLGELSDLGLRCVGTGNRYVKDTGFLRHAMEYAGNFGLLVVLTSEDPDLAQGSVHEGLVSTVTGLRATPAAAEEVAVARHIALCELTGTPTHLLKLSSEAGVRLVREARQRGVPMTASVTAHHLVLTDTAVQTFDPQFKVIPPLRTEADRRALVAGLSDGTLSCIVSDHGPRAVEDKDVEFDSAAAGASGLELTFPLVNSLVLSGELTLDVALGALGPGPRLALGLDGGKIAADEPADLVLLDKSVAWKAEASSLESRGKNTVAGGRTLVGRPVMTIRRGEVTYNRLSGNK
ncbi:MAG: dihydroorotase [Deltaproteobacteria bacterium]|nr:dihydroorotase [Deltaproteobacteria bacterium]